MTPNEAADAVRDPMRPADGEAADPTRIHAILFYAHGFHLATTGRRFVMGRFDATRTGVVLIGPEDPEAVSTALRREAHMKDVASVFGDWSADRLFAAVRSERPWIEASARPSGSPVAIGDDDLRLHFETMLDEGRHAVEALGIRPEAGRPWWSSSYLAAVDLKRIEGHPSFDDARSRRIRLGLGLGEMPGSLGRPDATARHSLRVRGLSGSVRAVEG